MKKLIAFILIFVLFFAGGYSPILNKSHPLTIGLEGCWPLTEGGGNKLINAVASSPKNGTNVGATWSQWDKGNCLNFVRTSSQYVSMPQSPYSIKKDKPFTLSAWIKTSNANLMTIMADWNILVTDGWEFTISEFNAGKMGIILTDIGGNNYFGRRGGTNVNDGLWRHVVATFDGSNAATGINLYVNGVLETMTNLASGTTNPGNLFNTDFRIGARKLSNAENQFFDGSIALPMVWSRELKPAEVWQLYANSNQMFIND